MKRKGQSLTRQIKRGHVKGVINPMTMFVELYRRTTTSKEHTVFVGQVNLYGNGN